MAPLEECEVLRRRRLHGGKEATKDMPLEVVIASGSGLGNLLPVRSMRSPMRTPAPETLPRFSSHNNRKHEPMQTFLPSLTSVRHFGHNNTKVTNTEQF